MTSDPPRPSTCRNKRQAVRCRGKTLVQNLAAKLRRRYRHKIINQNSRAYLARSGNRYDVIQLENWGTSVPGSAALNQEHYFTIEAFSEYWNHLTPQGVAIISRKLLLPPSDSLRLWAAAYEALKRQGVARPDNHLAILRNFDTFTLLVSKSSVNYQRIVDFAASRNFDLVFLTGMPPGLANRFNVFDRPFHFEEINRLADSAAMHQAKRLVAEEPNRLPAYTVEMDVLQNLKRIYYFAKRMARAAVPTMPLRESD